LCPCARTIAAVSHSICLRDFGAPQLGCHIDGLLRYRQVDEGKCLVLLDCGSCPICADLRNTAALAIAGAGRGAAYAAYPFCGRRSALLPDINLARLRLQ